MGRAGLLTLKLLFDRASTASGLPAPAGVAGFPLPSTPVRR